MRLAFTHADICPSHAQNVWQTLHAIHPHQVDEGDDGQDVQPEPSIPSVVQGHPQPITHLHTSTHPFAGMHAEWFANVACPSPPLENEGTHG